jgi:hypothetical protein
MSIEETAIDFTALQEAQNILTAFNYRLMRALKTATEELSLLFFFWEATDSDTTRRIVQNIPIWNFAAFSHLPLLHSIHHLSTLDPRVLRAREATTNRGDAMVTFNILTNKAHSAVDYESTQPENWPATIPAEGPSGKVFVYKAEKDAPGSFLNLWDECAYPDDIDYEGRVFETEEPAIKVWAKLFDLGAFLTDPKPLSSEISSFLS